MIIINCNRTISFEVSSMGIYVLNMMGHMITEVNKVRQCKCLSISNHMQNFENILSNDVPSEVASLFYKYIRSLEKG